MLHKNIYSQTQHFNMKHCIEWPKQEEGGAVQLGRPPVHGPGHHRHRPDLHLHRAGGPGGRGPVCSTSNDTVPTTRAVNKTSYSLTVLGEGPNYILGHSPN